LSEDVNVSAEREEVNINFSPWIISPMIKKFQFRPDWLVTIVEPPKEIKKMYEEKVNGQNSEVSFTQE
jgi:hypothetical protein